MRFIMKVIFLCIMILNKAMNKKESKTWSLQEDKALVEIIQHKQIKKWNIIAQTMREEFQIMGKSAKQCRDRYIHHLSGDIRKNKWTEEEQLQLQKLHNSLGNKWVSIAKILNRSDNDVKNHYHSKLRKGLRILNSFISKFMRNEFRPLKNNIISKILKTAKQFERSQNNESQNLSQQCFRLKNKILSYLKIDEETIDLRDTKEFIKEMNQFNRISRWKNWNKKEKKNPEKLSVTYKGKDIKILLSQEENHLHNNSDELESQELENQEQSEKESSSQRVLENRRKLSERNIAKVQQSQQQKIYPFFNNHGYPFVSPFSSFVSPFPYQGNTFCPLPLNYIPYQIQTHQFPTVNTFGEDPNSQVNNQHDLPQTELKNRRISSFYTNDVKNEEQ